MGFNSGFKGLVYIMHLVGYFVSCMKINGFMSVKQSKTVERFYDLLRGLLQCCFPMASVESLFMEIIGRYEKLKKKKYLLTFLRDFVSTEHKHNYLLAVCDVIILAAVALCPSIRV